MHRRVLQRPKVGKQLVNIGLGHSVVQIGHEQLRGARLLLAAGQCPGGAQHLAAALEHVVLPCAVHVALDMWREKWLELRFKLWWGSSGVVSWFVFWVGWLDVVWLVVVVGR